jgi:hypothetical protein
MNHAKRTLSSLLLGLTVLLATLAIPLNPASAGTPTGEKILPNTVSDQDAEALIKLYGMEDEVEVKNITVKIYNNNDELIYSVEVCLNDFECDERINRIINDSDFITEVDNTRIYYLDQ